MKYKHYNLGQILDGQAAVFKKLAHHEEDRRLDGSADREKFSLREDELAAGMVVLGQPGSGKSRLLRKLILEHRRNRRGFLLIDPGDLIPDVLGDFANEVIATGDERLLRKVHLLEPHPGQLARIDPFGPPDWQRIHPEVRPLFQKSWAEAKVAAVGQMLLRSKGQVEFGVQVRLLRVLGRVMGPVARLVAGRHLPLAASKALTDVFHPDHSRVYEQVKGRLTREELGHFQALHALRRPQDIRAETESTQNLLDAGLGMLVSQILSGTGAEPCFCLRQAIANGDYVLVNIARTPFASQQQNVFFGALMVQEWMDSLLECPRDQRRGTTLIIDEVHLLLPALPDLPRFQRICRKYGGPDGAGIVMATQDRASLWTAERDMAPEILGLADKIVAFRMTWPEDVELVERLLFGASLDYTPLVHEIYQAQGDYDWVKVQETSRSQSSSTTWSQADGTGENETDTEGDSEQETEQTTWSSSRSRQKSRGKSGTRGTSRTTNRSHRPADTHESTTLGATTGGTSTEGSSESSSEGDTDASGGGLSQARGRTRSRTLGHQTSQTNTQGGGSGETISVSEKLVPLPVQVRVEQATGQLEVSTADQQSMNCAEISSQQSRHAIVRVRGGQVIRIRTVDVPDPFTSAIAQEKAVAWFKRKLYETHGYFFTPSLDDQMTGKMPEEAEQIDEEEAEIGAEEQWEEGPYL